MLRPSLPAGWRGNRLPRPKAGCASQALGSKLNRMNLFRPFRADKETPKKLETHTLKSTEELGRSNSLRSGCCGELKPSCFAALAAAAGWPRHLNRHGPKKADPQKYVNSCGLRASRSRRAPLSAPNMHAYGAVFPPFFRQKWAVLLSVLLSCSFEAKERAMLGQLRAPQTRQ